MKTSIKLCEFDDILNARHIYSLLCLTSLRNKFYGICSKAFVKVGHCYDDPSYFCLYYSPLCVCLSWRPFRT